jgi:hypothetical protein
MTRTGCLSRVPLTFLALDGCSTLMTSAGIVRTSACVSHLLEAGDVKRNQSLAADATAVGGCGGVRHGTKRLHNGALQQSGRHGSWTRARSHIESESSRAWRGLQLSSMALACRGWCRTRQHSPDANSDGGRVVAGPVQCMRNGRVLRRPRRARPPSTVAVGPLLKKRRKTGAALVLRVASDGEAKGSTCGQAACQRMVEHSPEVRTGSDVC